MSAGRTDRPITLVAALYVNQGHEAEFEQFESAAAEIMARHGGRVERRIVCDPGEDHPHEIHIVTFPSERAFESYRADPAMGTLADLRQRAIRQTTLWRGIEVIGAD